MKKLFLLLFFCSPAFAAAPFPKEKRQDYVKHALAATLSAPKQTLDNLYQFVTMVEQSSCRSAFDALTLSCLQDQVQRNCRSQGGNCPLLSDVIVVNKLNEKQFVTREERVQIMKQEGTGNYAAIYSRLVSRKYALLATELLLLQKRTCRPEEHACLARELDDYCIQNSDVKNIPWQACVSAIIWYIGVNR